MHGMKRTIGRWATVGAVALILAGAVAAPAGAMRRSQAVRMVNQIIWDCFSIGGDPYVEEATGAGFVFTCWYEDGSVNTLEFEYDGDDGGSGRAASRSAASDMHALAADDRGDGNADAADHGRQKAHKQHKHKTHKHDRQRRPQ
jgi:hypothetical protein